MFTRARGSDTPSLLDLILTNNELKVSSVEYKGPVGAIDQCDSLSDGCG